MFSIIISEKGGSERREGFDKTEINVGRVQGNDLMLPKGNVSKRHARLLYRDGRFIVTDLKSTNGTYVNGRKIAQATIVREGDKIYIGDFVLRIELAGDGAAQQPQAAPHEEPSEDASNAEQQPGFRQPSSAGLPPPLPGAPTAGPPPMPMQMPGQPPQAMPPSGMGPQPVAAQGIAPPGPIPAQGAGAPAPLGARETALGPGPRLGLDGNIIAPAMQQPAMPPPPMVAPAIVPQPVAPQVAPPAPAAPMVPSPEGAPPPPPALVPSAPQPVAPAPVASTPSPEPSSPPLAPPPIVHPAQAAQQAPTAPPPKVSGPPPAAPASIPASSQPAQSPRSSVRSGDVVDSSQAAAHRAALGKLMERAASAVDTAPLASGEPPSPALASAIERALAEKASSMRSSGELPPNVDSEILVAEARRELFELGPIGPLLDDEYVEEVQVIRHDHVVALHGKKQVATEIAFTSEAAAARIVRRICVRSGKPLGPNEHFVERRLDRGARLFGVLPPASGDGHMLVIRKPQRALATLDELVRNGTISRQMATLLAQAVQGRANILVTGGVGAGGTTILGALAGAGNLEDRVVVLQEDDELVLNQPHTVSMLIGDTAEEGARAVHAAIRVRPDRLVIGAFAGHVVAEIVDAIGDGVDGVLAAARAPTLRHLVARLPADVAATKRMLQLDTAREWLAGSFDLVVEVARLRDGRNRVMRVAEFSLAQGQPLDLRDIFTFTVERTAAGGTVEGSFHPTGVVPRIAEDLVARGMPLDLSIFKRASR
jgi:pilus assembly protein CpaF